MNQVALANEAETRNILSELMGEEEQKIKLIFLKLTMMEKINKDAMLKKDRYLYLTKLNLYTHRKQKSMC